MNLYLCRALGILRNLSIRDRLSQNDIKNSHERKTHSE
jgi:hypothetical protein